MKQQLSLRVSLVSIFAGVAFVIGQTGVDGHAADNAGPRIVTDAEIQKARRAEELKNRQEVDQLVRQTLADLENPDPKKRLSAVNCLSGWPIAEANKDAVITGLMGVLD
ncbi:MAG: hypothetical protein GY832_35860, partial [Chloroflexi bacterium]|nr:hypothetical protein [Chloroflexota bacterium]